VSDTTDDKKRYKAGNKKIKNFSFSCAINKPVFLHGVFFKKEKVKIK